MWFHLLVLTIVSRAAHYSQHQKNPAYYMSGYSKTKCDFSKRNAQKKQEEKPYGFLPALNIL